MTTALAIPDVKTWQWQGFSIRYQHIGGMGAPVLCIHGFGASSDHWRKNLPAYGENFQAYAIDLIGFGFSDKPTPGQPLPYTFETWGQQILDFCREVIGQPAYLVANSIGCIVALQAAVDGSEWVKGIVMLNCSIRLLHERRRAEISWHQRLSTPVVQQLLGYSQVGRFFFSRIAQRKVIRNLLGQAYHRPEAITDELVEAILGPALTEGAADVFLAFVRYSQGPLPEDLLPQLQCPVWIIWGQDDPWEPVAMGRGLANYPTVQSMEELPGVGHCPQDEAPELVNPLVLGWLSQAELPAERKNS
ncbi:alpha/beta fold hydrolase [Nodosilinea sp. FACHB-13]|uniref:alpha/beta fold hydrolase n=1 Tax=Cyanophyceae TaxID=3028117 RepID=UPI00168921F1|nr:alpha/beta fold hydrolase [Nodosilinea sp. FACHB-13]